MKLSLTEEERKFCIDLGALHLTYSVFARWELSHVIFPMAEKERTAYKAE